MVFLENINLENNDDNEDVVEIEDMLNVENMLGMMGNDSGSEDEGPIDGDWADLPLLLQDNVIMDFNPTDSDDDNDWD